VAVTYNDTVVTYDSATVAYDGGVPLGRPTAFVVAIEFTPAVWTDVSTYVDWQEPTTIRRGRNSVLDVAQMGTCSVTLFNNDGRFTPTSSSPYYPNVRPNVRLRVTVNGYDRFTGYVDDWSPVYPSNSGDEARVTVTATDRFKPLSRRQLNSTYTETVRQTLPVPSVWQLDGVGTSCPDILGNALPAEIVTYLPSQVTGLSGTTSYAASGPARVSSGVRLEAGADTNTVAHNGYLVTDDSSGAVVQLPPGVNFALSATPWTLGMWAKIDKLYNRNAASGATLQYGATLAGCNGGGEWSIWLESNDGSNCTAKMTDNSAAAFFATSGWGLEVVDGLFHYYAIVWDGTSLSLHRDGYLWVTGNPAAPRSYAPTVSLMGYVFESQPSVSWWAATSETRRVWNHPDVTVSSVTYTPMAMSASDMAEIMNASVTGFAAELTQDRAWRLFAMADIPWAEQLADNGPASLLGSSQARHGALDTAGKDLLTLFQEVAQAERGVFYIDGSGIARMADRYARAMDSAPDATFAQEADTSGTDFAAPLNDSRIVNSVTVTAATGGSATAIAAESTSLNGTLTSAVSLGVSDSVQAAHYAHWQVSAFGDAVPRVDQVTVDLLTSSTAGIYDTTLALDIGSHIEVTGLPASSASTVFHGYVEGLTEVYSQSAVAVTFDTSPITPGEIVLDDDILGRLESNGEGLTAAVTSSATTLPVTASPGFYWTGADLPYDIQVGSEQMTVTAGSAPSLTRTNMMTNGDFETTSLTGWTYTDATINRVRAKSYSGSWSAQVVYTVAHYGGDAYADFEVSGLSGGTTYTLSARIWVPAGMPKAQMVIYHSGVVATGTTTRYGCWEQVTATFTSYAATAHIRIGNAELCDIGDYCFVDAILWEASAAALPYFDSPAHAGTQSLTVTRGVNGTAAAAHPIGAPVTIAGSLVLAY